MKILSRILRRLNILCIRFTDDGGEVFSVAMYTFDKGKPVFKEIKPLPDPAVEKGALEKAPLVAVVSGKGVITKDAAAGNIAKTVTSDPATFLWTISGDRISFVRRTGLTAATERLKDTGIVPLYIECLPGENDETMAEVVERFASEHLDWRRLSKPSVEGSSLASLVAGRLMLPVLGVLLVALLANFMVSPRVNGRFQEATATLAALRKTSSAGVETDRRRQAAIEEFSHKLPHGAATLSDVIGAVVPEKIVLGELGIAPVTKALEAGKPLVQNRDVITIVGETTVSEAIAQFTTTLAELSLGTVRLASVQQDRERSVLIFRIEITL